MKNLNLFKIAIFSLLAFTTSCREELTDTSSDKTNIIDQAAVKNGRLYFPNKESLSATYKNLKKENLESVQNFIDEKGIESLVPVITQKNENKVISELKSRKIEYLEKKSSRAMKTVSVSDEDIYDDIDDLEEIVGDEVYSTMLNGKAEIQVADKIYKYTDVGLFVTTEENYSRLENYLEVRKISSNLLVPTETFTRDSFISDKANDELITLPNTDNKISYFRSSVPRRSGGTGGFTGGGSTSGNNGGFRPPTVPQEPSIASIVEKLPIGEVKKPWLGNIFGKTWTTYDKYESRRRVKVKFYSQNLYLVYAIGCKVKHQYKGWTGLWRKENADQLGIGVNSIKWTFNHSMNMSAPAGVPKQAYWFGSNMYTTSDGISFTFSKNQNIPSLPFASKLDGLIQFTVDFTGLTEEKLDKLFWETAWKQANNFIEGQNKKLNRVLFVVDSYSASYVRYYDFSQIENNQDVIERVFDFGIASPQVTYTFGGGTGNGLDVTSYKWNFSKPDAVAVSMYGIAKKNGAWHGVKLNAN
ncbi:hypothetical protein [Chryseobacterium sp. WX]|uniref:hypothetical protein n=1 Tax=Chryseobacterium sp. WX TaxID=3031803 RepID=UPI0024098BC3|nr:hypothetical protein [Chryseobacterium sp. WX]WFB69320.1 hypothetical protein PZ898_07805 [Chryseobacterium sp. WX]